MKIAKYFLTLGILVLLSLQFSCRKDFSTINSNGNLSFSTDTLFLDTVFNNLTTTTHFITVYNKTNNDVTVPSIKLEKANSKYRLNIDGVPGTTFNEVLIRKQDSIFVQIEATILAEETDEMLYEDKILFDPNGITQSVQLVTLVQDANLLFPASGETEFELTQSTFTNEKPYVIYGKANIPENGSLTVDAGSIVYFNKDACLNVSNGATLNIEGSLTDSIVFKGDQLNYTFNEVAGQWKGITIQENTFVSIDYLRILNSTTAICIKENSNVVNLKNVEIYNAGNIGIETKNANINAENLVIGANLKAALYLQGGNYTFNHCTFANYWNKSFRNESNITLANFFYNDVEEKTLAPLNTANFTNCIIAGSKVIGNEVEFDKDEDETIFNFNFTNCILEIKEDEIGFLNITNTNYYSNCLFNTNLDFYKNTNNDFRIGLDNSGINQAENAVANTIPLDILGEDRTSAPDIGAYQHLDFKTLATTEDE